MKKVLIILMLLILTGSILVAQSLCLEIMNLRSHEGQVQLSFYKNSNSFKTDKPFLTKNFNKKSVSNGCMKICIELEPGVYGVAMMDDENANGKMDYNLFGLPKEGFGFSNYLKRIRSRPDFNAFKFTLSDSVQVRIKANYM